MKENPARDETAWNENASESQLGEFSVLAAANTPHQPIPGTYPASGASPQRESRASRPDIAIAAMSPPVELTGILPGNPQGSMQPREVTRVQVTSAPSARTRAYSIAHASREAPELSSSEVETKHEAPRDEVDYFRSELDQQNRRHDRDMSDLRHSGQQRQHEAIRKVEDYYDHHLEIKRIEHETAIQELQEALSAESTRAEEAEKALKSITAKTESLGATIRSLQAARLKTVEVSQWEPLGSENIEHRFKSLMQSVRAWSGKYSILPFEEIFQDRNFEAIHELLWKRRCVGELQDLKAAVENSKAMRKPGKASGLFLAAAASSEICTKIINDPFFAFVGETGQDYVLWQNTARQLKRLLHLIKLGDAGGAEALRCQFLRLLDPPNGGHDEELAIVKSMATESRRVSVRLVVNRIMRDFEPFFRSDSLQEAKKVLQEIVENAADLSWTLWTRKPQTKVYGWKDLGEQKEQELRYSSTSALLEAHPLHSTALDENPQAFNGCKVILLCSPAIVMRGDAEGQDYHKNRVHKKAVVWLG